MALATRCPHCSTVFKVANDQLKLRGGLVRCGVCKEVFNGAESLVPLERNDAAPTSSGGTPETPAPSKPEPPGTPANASPVLSTSSPSALTRAAVPPDSFDHAKPAAPADPSQPSQPPPASTAPPAILAGGATTGERDTTTSDVSAIVPGSSPDQSPMPSSVATAANPAADPLLRMTLLDIAQQGNLPPDGNASDGANLPDPDLASQLSAASADHAPDPLAKAIDDLNSRPVSGSAPATPGDAEDRAIDPDLPEPAFLARAPEKPRLAAMMRIGVGLLVLALVFQLSYLLRHRIVSAFPATEAVFAGVCGLVDCTPLLPADVESVVIESSELQEAAGNAGLFNLSFALHNRSGTAQAWPHIELTLNDAADQPVIRRVFAPGEYVPTAPQRERGLAPGREESFRIAFELAQPRASGYKIYVFYP